MAASANALNPRLIDRKFYIAAAIGFPLIDSSVARYAGSFIFAPPGLRRGLYAAARIRELKRTEGESEPFPGRFFFPAGKQPIQKLTASREMTIVISNLIARQN